MLCVGGRNKKILDDTKCVSLTSAHSECVLSAISSPYTPIQRPSLSARPRAGSSEALAALAQRTAAPQLPRRILAPIGIDLPNLPGQSHSCNLLRCCRVRGGGGHRPQRAGGAMARLVPYNAACDSTPAAVCVSRAARARPSGDTALSPALLGSFSPESRAQRPRDSGDRCAKQSRAVHGRARRKMLPSRAPWAACCYNGAQTAARGGAAACWTVAATIC